MPAYGVREPQGSATQTAYLSLRLEELSERIERAERLPQPPTEAAASAMEHDIAELLTLADELATQMPASTRLILQRLTLEHQALRRSAQDSSAGNGSRINFEERRRESLLRLGAAREDLLARLERQSAWSASLRDISRNWMLYATLLAAAVLLLALHRYRRAPIAMATPAGRVEDVDRNLGDADVSRLLPHLADWILLCDAHGRVERVLAGDLARVGLHADAAMPRTLSHLTSTLSADTASLLPVPGEQVAVTLTEFGADPETAVPVRLIVARLGPSPHCPLLAIARDRRDEVQIEEEIRGKVSQLARLRADSDALRRRILDMEEQAQTRIGQELHDDVGQQLAGIAFLAKALANRLEREENRLSQEANWIAQIANRSVESCRSLSHQLSSPHFSNGEVGDALRRLCADTSNLFGVDCVYCPARAWRNVGAIDADVSRHMLRVVQEAINNAIRHGRADRILVRLERRSLRLRLSIVDRGSGMSSGSFTHHETTGLGFSSMQARARQLRGRLRVRSGARGTVVMLTVPHGIYPA
ncbi:ATP-binding protein [Tahibacter sp. UC22_41]|uniref:sensor histidine kinase n=1 Tax=Tahibacter sp. UC22_41 TaxID=3350178 RepID=UPI0036DF43F0